MFRGDESPPARHGRSAETGARLRYASVTASLNVNAATACVLSWFAAAVGYAEVTREGAKYVVKDGLHALWKPK